MPIKWQNDLILKKKYWKTRKLFFYLFPSDERFFKGTKWIFFLPLPIVEHSCFNAKMNKKIQKTWHSTHHNVMLSFRLCNTFTWIFNKANSILSYCNKNKQLHMLWKCLNSVFVDTQNWWCIVRSEFSGRQSVRECTRCVLRCAHIGSHNYKIDGFNYLPI